jgi:hypothetical protein
VCFSAITLNAQESLKFLGTPENSFGYYIWQNDDPAAMYHRYEIERTIKNTTDTLTIIIERGEIWRENHLFFPLEYYNEAVSDTSFEFSIYAVDENHQDIPDEYVTGQPGGSGEVDCFWECVSSTYAFKIQQFNTPNGNHNYRLMATTPFGSFAPPYYYEWVDPGFYISNLQVDLFNATDASWRDYYGITHENEFDAMAADQIIQIDNSGSYFTSNGVEIEGPQFVYGIKKHIGPYADYLLEDIEYGPTTADHCDFYEMNQLGLNGMMNVMNDQLYNNGSINTIIECPSNLADYDYVDNNGGNGDPWQNDYIKLLDKYLKWLTKANLGNDDGIVIGEVDWNEFVSDFYSFQLGEYEDATARFAEIALNSSMFRLSKIDIDTTELIVNGSGYAFTDPEGYPNIPVISFTPGFYKLSIFNAERGLYNTFFEVRSTFVAGSSHKDFFSATIYPNPNTEDFYFANVQTTAKLKGRYEVFDGQGNLHYSYNFNLPKNHTGNHRIAPDIVLPSGMLYHKFSFLDGSYETYTTIKQ